MSEPAAGATVVEVESIVVVVGAGASIAGGAAVTVESVVVSVVELSLLQDAANRPSARAIAPNFTIFMMFVFGDVSH